MNIVHVIGGTSLGGGQTLMENLIYHTQGREMPTGRIHNQVVSLTGNGVIGERLIAAGIPVTELNMRHLAGRIAPPIRLARLIRRSRPVIVNAWLYEANLVAALAVCFASGAPIIWGIHCHDPTYQKGRKRRRSRRIAKIGGWLSAYMPDAVVYGSNNTRIVHEAAGYRPRDSRVIFNGFDTDLFRPDPAARISVRRELGLGGEVALVGFASSFTPVKDHELFLAALARVKAGNIHAILCGRGNESHNRDLMRLIKGAGVAERVHLLGPRQDMPRLTASWDLAVSSSWGEGFSSAIGEALSAGIPCVTTKIGDVTDVVAQAGRVIHSRNPDDLAAAMDSVLALSPEERTALGQQGRKEAARLYGMETHVKKWMNLYETLAEKA